MRNEKRDLMRVHEAIFMVILSGYVGIVLWSFVKVCKYGIDDSLVRWFSYLKIDSCHFSD